MLVLLSFLVIASAVYGQDTTLSRPLTKLDYLQKSKSQKTAAWVLLGAGGTLIAIAAPGNVSFDILPVLAIGGSAAIIGSIPLFIAAGKNKRRALAMTANFNIQHTPITTYPGLSKRSFPGISVKLNF
ncbi:MAG: hypothetical protein EOO10_17975 [Chitinophagaceae bacterium]|nr:MAG: hypothetical protein EOO10_17975 [Chitinophagaceae bacterium]